MRYDPPGGGWSTSFGHHCREEGLGLAQIGLGISKWLKICIHWHIIKLWEQIMLDIQRFFHLRRNLSHRQLWSHLRISDLLSSHPPLPLQYHRSISLTFLILFDISPAAGSWPPLLGWSQRTYSHVSVLKVFVFLCSSLSNYSVWSGFSFEIKTEN